MRSDEPRTSAKEDANFRINEINTTMLKLIEAIEEFRDHPSTATRNDVIYHADNARRLAQRTRIDYGAPPPMPPLRTSRILPVLGDILDPRD